MNIVFTAGILISYFSVSAESVPSEVVDWDDYFPYSNVLNEEHGFKLYWKDIHKDVNDPSNDIIEFGMEAQTTGYIAAGFSPTAKMPNSDIFLGWVGDNGETYLYDMYTKTERITPYIDDQNDLTLQHGEIIDGKTRIRFTRPKFLCNDQDLAVQIGTTRVIFAFNDQKPENISDLIQHTVFGGKSINLDVGFQTLAEDLVDEEEDIIIGNITMEDHPIATQETEYYCKLFALPPLDEIHHIVKFAPWITPGNEAYVHHFNLYHCPAAKVNVSNIGHGAPCDEWGVAENMPAKACIGLGVTDAIHVIYAWGVGMVDSVLPHDVGVELGGTGADALRYGMLEMHYDNPDKIENLIDHSGFTYYYTPNLRPISAAIMTVGHYYDERHFVPEGLKTVNYGYCHSECTKEGLPDEGVTVFGVFLHGHPIATALKLRHVRNGIELNPIEVDLGYDFDYQQMIAVDNVQLKPGDDLILECDENNYRNRTTFGGIETSTEMCLAFLWVYPKPVLRTCVSTFTDEDLLKFQNGSKAKGYLNEDADLLQYHAHYNQKHQIPLNYDITMDGATPYYNNLWLNDENVDESFSYKRHFKCFDAEGEQVWHDGTVYTDHTYDIPIFEERINEEICYNDDNYINYEDNNNDDDNDKNGDNMNIIIGVSILGGVMFIIIVIFAIIYCKKSNNINNKNSETRTYSKVKSTNIDQETNENTEDVELTV